MIYFCFALLYSLFSLWWWPCVIIKDCVLKDSGKGKALKIVNGGGWKDTVVWSPYGNEGMGYKNFM